MQTCSSRCQRGRAGKWQLVGRLLALSLLLGELGQVAGLAVSGDGGQRGFSVRDTATAVGSKSSKRGFPLHDNLGEMSKVKDSEHMNGVNSAISLMIDYAHDRNFSNCWLCQNMPTSIHSSMLSPIPFTKADYKKFNWNGLGLRLNDETGDCYTPSYPIDTEKSTKYADIAQNVVQAINNHYLPVGFNHTVLLKIIHIQMYVKLGFEYRVQIGLSQTNCSDPSKDQVCVPQAYTPIILAEALVYVTPWAGSVTVGSVKIQVRNCTEPQQSEQTEKRDCSVYLPPVPTQALPNVSLCFRGVGSGKNELGQSSCNIVINVTLKQSPLPERVYLICGEKAYRCMPYEQSQGVCYLAYLIPLIRRVDATEIASLYPPLHRYRREITSSQQVIGILMPWYGVYVSQQELASLSKVLESHLNASSRAMLAEHKELQEVKTAVLQNRMALDLLLASQGGTCKVIGTECCSYISDATGEVMDMVHETAKGIKELHANHGFHFGDFSGILGPWGSGLVKLLIALVVVFLLLIFLCICMGQLIRLMIQKTTESVIQAPQVCTMVEANVNNNVVTRYYDVHGFEEWIQRLGLDDISLEDDDEEEEEETRDM